MNYIGILEGIEKLIIEIIFWIIFIPKTIFKIIVNPNWVSGYITNELEKDSNRFDNHISPVLLFILSSLILFIVFDYLTFTVLERQSASGFKFGYDPSQDVASNINSYKGVIAGVGFLSIPLFFTLIIRLLKKPQLDRKSLYRLFSIHCYFLTPLSIAYFMLLIGSKFYSITEFFYIYMFGILGVLTWFIIIEINFIKIELNYNIWKAIAVFIFLFICVVVGIIYLVLNTHDGELKLNFEGLEKIIGIVFLIFIGYALIRGVWSILKKTKANK